MAAEDEDGVRSSWPETRIAQGPRGDNFEDPTEFAIEEKG